MFGRSLLVMTRLLQLCDIHPFPLEPTHASLLLFVSMRCRALCAGTGSRWCVGLVRVVRLYQALLLTKDGTWPTTTLSGVGVYFQKDRSFVRCL
jgi:hypothetical protein